MSARPAKVIAPPDDALRLAMKAEYVEKQKEYEIKKARAKALKLRMTCTICGEKAKLNCPCGTTQYCSTECQRIDWRDRGHRKACKKIRDERAAEAARAEAPPSPPPSPPKPVVYGPAPRSHADEIRARIAAEHEAARARREANPEPKPASARWGSRCPICLEDWDVNGTRSLLTCCCRRICNSCDAQCKSQPVCPLCGEARPKNDKEVLDQIRRQVDNDIPEAMYYLGGSYFHGNLGLAKSPKKAAKIWKRSVELGNVEAMAQLGYLYLTGNGVKLDKKKAIQLLRTSADGGYANAQYLLSKELNATFLAYAEAEAAKFDRGERRDIDENALMARLRADYQSPRFDSREVYRYARLSAEQGLRSAMFAVGLSHIQGHGVERDLDEARRWLERAAAAGDARAIEELEKLNA